MQLLWRIEAHLRRSGTKPTRFGRDAINDPMLVHDLRLGREPRPKTAARITGYLDRMGGGGVNRTRLDPALAGLIRALRLRDGGQRRDGGMIVLLEADSTPWASATFAGARHRLAVRCEGDRGADRAAALAEGIDEAEFVIPGHLVVDIGAVEVVADELRFEALTVADDCSSPWGCWQASPSVCASPRRKPWLG